MTRYQAGQLWVLATMDEGVIAKAVSYRQAKMYAEEHFIDPVLRRIRPGFYEVNGSSGATVWFGKQHEMVAEGWDA